MSVLHRASICRYNCRHKWRFTDDIIIQPGIYDIIQEYQDHYGADIFQKMAYRSTEYNFFQAGLYVTERKMTFLPGAVVKCDYPEDQLADDKRFSAFATGENFTIEGLVLYGNNLYYAIHDDYGLHDTYINQFLIGIIVFFYVKRKYSFICFISEKTWIF